MPFGTKFSASHICVSFKLCRAAIFCSSSLTKRTFYLFFQPDVLLPCLSEEQLSALLEECMQSQRTVTSPTLPEFQGSFPDVMRPCCNTFEDSIRDSRNELLDEAHNLGMLTSHRMTGGDEVKDVCSKGMIENSGSNLSQALVESHLTEDAMIEGGESDNQEGQQDANVSNSEGNFMSIALSTERMKNLSFPDEPFYCISTNDELPTDVDIPVMPLKTVEGEPFNIPFK